MKDEMSGKVISEFAGLKSKMYSLVAVDGVAVCKISLSCFDNKKYLLDDGVSSLAYGHKDIKYFFCLFDLIITL